MEASFWHARWNSNRIGFHNPEPHELLRKHWQHAATQTSATPRSLRILAPLCGKSLDLHWLAAQGHAVLGIELSPLAAEAFFAEQNVNAHHTDIGPYRFYWNQRTGILVGDCFQLQRKHIEQALETTRAGQSAEATADNPLIDMVFDRAALVALPETENNPMRSRYVEHIEALCPQAPIFLITVEYDPSLRDGPPFSVMESDVRQRFAQCDTKKLGAVNSMLRDLEVQEGAYFIRRADSAKD